MYLCMCVCGMHSLVVSDVFVFKLIQFIWSQVKWVSSCFWGAERRMNDWNTFRHPLLQCNTMSKRASVAKPSILVQACHVLPNPHHLLSFDSCYSPSASGCPPTSGFERAKTPWERASAISSSAQFPSFNLELQCMHTIWSRLKVNMYQLLCMHEIT